MGYPRVSLHVEEWPDADRAAWARATAAGDVWEDEAPSARWATKTRTQVAKDYGRFLWWLNEQGRLDLALGPRERLTRDNLAAYVGHLQAAGMASTSLLSRVRNLRQAIQAMDPDGDLRMIGRVCARLKARAEQVRRKELRLVPASELVDRALRDYDKVLRLEHPSVADAVRARDALMMAFLAHLPLRLANFATLCLDTHVHRDAVGFLVRLAADEPKEHRPYDTRLPDLLVPYLDHFLGVVRPVLLRGAVSDSLWISMDRAGMSESAIYYQVNKVTRRLTGKPINPHLFRDIVLTSITTDAPENVKAGARILGHRDLRTGEKHYNYATALSAQRQYLDLVKRLRDRPAEEED